MTGSYLAQLRDTSAFRQNEGLGAGEEASVISFPGGSDNSLRHCRRLVKRSTTGLGPTIGRRTPPPRDYSTPYYRGRLPSESGNISLATGGFRQLPNKVIVGNVSGR